MKKKISFATTLTTVILFYLLATTTVPFLFFGTFTMLLVRGIIMFGSSITENYQVNENQPQENVSKLVAVRFIMQLIPAVFILICFFVFFLRKEIWLSFLTR